MIGRCRKSSPFATDTVIVLQHRRPPGHCRRHADSTAPCPPQSGPEIQMLAHPYCTCLVTAATSLHHCPYPQRRQRPAVTRQAHGAWNPAGRWSSLLLLIPVCVPHQQQDAWRPYPPLRGRREKNAVGAAYDLSEAPTVHTRMLA